MQEIDKAFQEDSLRVNEYAMNIEMRRPLTRLVKSASPYGFLVKGENLLQN